MLGKVSIMIECGEVWQAKFDTTLFVMILKSDNNYCWIIQNDTVAKCLVSSFVEQFTKYRVAGLMKNPGNGPMF